MADLTFSRDIAAAPNEVFAFFIPQRMPLWYGTEMKACFEVQGGAAEFAVGQKVRIIGQLQNHTMSLTAVISACEWQKLLEWQFEDCYGVRGFQRWELTPPASVVAPTTDVSHPRSHSTRIVMRDSYRAPGLYGRMVDLVLTRFAVSMRDRSWLEHLDQLATRR